MRFKAGRYLALAMLLAGFTTANAHDMDGVLGPDSSASDHFKIQCFDDGTGAGPAQYLEIELLTTKKNPPIVSLQVRTEEPVKIWNITDPINTDHNPSRTIQVANNQIDTTLGYKSDGSRYYNANGYYYVTINKNKYGIQYYHFTYHCIGADHTGTEIFPLQNQ